MSNKDAPEAPGLRELLERARDCFLVPALAGDLPRDSVNQAQMIPQRLPLRSVYWRLFLGLLGPERPAERWPEDLRAYRTSYADLKQASFVEPAHESEDLSIHNPLSDSAESGWTQFFQDAKLQELVRLDLGRTHPGVEFFQSERTQQRLLDALFVWAKRHPEYGYRQGMNELLAVLLSELSRDSEDFERALKKEKQDPEGFRQLQKEFAVELPLLRSLLDPAQVEADAFACLERVLARTKDLFHHTARVRELLENGGADPELSSIELQCRALQTKLLGALDPELKRQLEREEVQPTLYGLRWIRLVFAREFPLPEVARIWDLVLSVHAERAWRLAERQAPRVWEVPGLEIASGFELTPYVCLAMLEQVRGELLAGDNSACLARLMRYPELRDVRPVARRALDLFRRDQQERWSLPASDPAASGASSGASSSSAPHGSGPASGASASGSSASGSSSGLGSGSGTSSPGAAEEGTAHPFFRAQQRRSASGSMTLPSPSSSSQHNQNQNQGQHPPNQQSQQNQQQPTPSKSARSKVRNFLSGGVSRVNHLFKSVSGSSSSSSSAAAGSSSSSSSSSTGRRSISSQRSSSPVSAASAASEDEHEDGEDPLLGSSPSTKQATSTAKKAPLATPRNASSPSPPPVATPTAATSAPTAGGAFFKPVSPRPPPRAHLQQQHELLRQQEAMQARAAAVARELGLLAQHLASVLPDDGEEDSDEDSDGDSDGEDEDSDTVEKQEGVEKSEKHEDEEMKSFESSSVSDDDNEEKESSGASKDENTGAVASEQDENAPQEKNGEKGDDKGEDAASNEEAPAEPASSSSSSSDGSSSSSIESSSIESSSSASAASSASTSATSVEKQGRKKERKERRKKEREVVRRTLAALLRSAELLARPDLPLDPWVGRERGPAEDVFAQDPSTPKEELQEQQGAVSSEEVNHEGFDNSKPSSDPGASAHPELGSDNAVPLEQEGRARAESSDAKEEGEAEILVPELKGETEDYFAQPEPELEPEPEPELDPLGGGGGNAVASGAQKGKKGKDKEKGKGKKGPVRKPSSPGVPMTSMRRSPLASADCGDVREDEDEDEDIFAAASEGGGAVKMLLDELL